ncbi:MULTISPECIES: isoleucine--tRNA ligase [Segatella]|uniref:Isoleucine--tRNA ligase n=2 Tax=Segatella TaxID=2974251 RepID=D8DWL1_9BACT|nr:MULTISPECIES: isoleucine--tRNA ligase [Segatella]MBQ3857719.1 isoleucine--tRNA ligase [Prevotella sp.]EFI72271.1 isoleucine--tRNA ligase [Segatella baroniae B14]OYP53486.1 isoleucine--tRNA ligase [Segatella bryantii]UKK78485.1 isoleucine--tRNA ligase [Segatella baroniae B14]UKK81519.1 isoleucine--tRNA ligase [Segatella bryantii]
MAKKFAEHNGLDLVKTNKDVLAEWEKNDIFHKSIDEREGCPQFIFFEGPPSANGHPGIHHVLARSIKDTFNRYKTMQGFQVHRKAGWDTHGLPVELGVEKELGITKKDIDNKASEKYISVEDYNKKCRENVMMFTQEWRTLTEEMGYFVDLDHPYITYDNKYIETLWWLLKQLYNKGLLYKGYTIQPYSPGAGTGLSSHELNQPGCYRDVKDTTVTAQFAIQPADWEVLKTKSQSLKHAKEWGAPYFLAWTTTPWTLASNTALCVGPKFDYVVIQTYNPYNAKKMTLIMANDLVNAYLKPEGQVTDDGELPEYQHGDKYVPYKIIAHFKGTDLEGIHYQQLMPWVKPCEKIGDFAPSFVNEYAAAHPEKVFASEDGRDKFVEMADEAFRVILGDYVTTDDGTGIVHIAPTFGADDAKVAKDANIPALYLISKKGETRPMVDLQGKYYLVDDLDVNFVKACVNDVYSHHAGDYVKNSYDPKYNPDGVWDKKASEKAEDLNVIICMEMKQEGTAFKIEKHVHNYPHCWRTDKPILYYPLDSWFIKDTAKKERMVELNKTINWQPESTGSGRFGNWLENLNDWNLSRSRFWGTPLNIWRDENRNAKCIGSLEELYAEIEKSVAAGVMTSNPLKDKGFIPGDYSQENYDKIDLHRPYIDRIILVDEEGKPMYRESDLIDVWFDSGSMPYAQQHYPFEGAMNAEALAATGKSEAEYREELVHSTYTGIPVPPAYYPADFINEGVDQTRGWFFTLHAISTMVFDQVAFKNVISSGLVLDAKGNKMSKHVGNVTNPFEMIDKYGADPVRFYMLTNSEPWDNLKFDPNGVDETRRKFFGTLYNTYSFFALYANVDNFDVDAPQVAFEKRPEIDRWILSCLNTLVKNVQKELDSYDPTRAGRLIESFVNDDLSNWYVRLNRKRFWGKEMSEDKLSAYQTLYACLMTVAKVVAPFAPFFADQLYKDLGGNLASVHLSQYPAVDETAINVDLEARMAIAQKITSMVLALRRKVNIKVRQPLQQIMIPAVNDEQKAHIEAVAELVKNEVNVKELKFVEGQGILVKKVKCNFRVMGKKYGKLMKGVAAHMSTLSQEQIALLEQNGSYCFELEDQSITVDVADVEIISEDIPGWLVSNEGNLTVALEVELTEELKKEGMARELINRIQNIRKDSGLEITDRVQITLAPQEEVEKAVEAYAELIKGQVLANSITIADNDGVATEFDDFSINIKVVKD